MRRNNIRAVWDAGRCVVNGWLAIPSSFSAEVMAHCGWDSLCIDIQHGLIDYQTATTMMQAISTTAVAPIVRALERSGIIMKCLDAGASMRGLPDDQQRRRRRAFCRGLPLSADGVSQPRPDPRADLWRQRLRHQSQTTKS